MKVLIPIAGIFGLAYVNAEWWVIAIFALLSYALTIEPPKKNEWGEHVNRD